MKRTILALSIWAIVAFHSLLWAQPAQLPFQLSAGYWQPKWQADRELQVQQPDGQSLSLLAPNFEGCSYDANVPNLPFVEVWLPETQQLTLGATQAKPEDASAYFLPLLDKLANLVPEGASWYPLTPIVYKGKAGVDGKTYNVYHVYPLQVSADGGQILRHNLISFRVEDTPAQTAKTNTGRSYADHSVLSTGNWYRVAVTQDGIYRMDRTFLTSLGLNLSGADPRKIRVHGYGGGMLPQKNNTPRPDDLPEIAVLVQGEGDGRFDAGDFVLFYGQSSSKWTFNTPLAKYRYEKNLYCDTTYYYITIGEAAGKRISTRATETQANADTIYTQHRQLDVLENDRRNLIRMGRYWFGDVFDAQTSYTYNLQVLQAVPNGNVRLRVRTAGRSDAATRFDVTAGSNTLGSLTHNGVSTGCFYCQYADISTGNFSTSSNYVQGTTLSLNLNYNKTGTSIGWLDYIEQDYDQNLEFTYGFLPIRLPRRTNQTQGFILKGGISASIWDVSDPLNPILQQTTSTTTPGQSFFAFQTDSLINLVAFNNSAYRAPVSIGKIGNQDLHGLGSAEYILITHPEYLEPANELAELHRTLYGRTAHVVSISQIYNEFSSGRQDPTAVRDFLKMLWDRAASADQRPRYALMFGNSSFDYKGIVGDRGRLPAYEARESFDPTEAYASDDFFGFMDDYEGFWGEGKPEFDPADISLETNYLDIAVGRVPSATLDEAKRYVEKVKIYLNSFDVVADWRNRVLLIGDYKTGECFHMNDADQLDRDKLKLYAPCMNVDKVYLDNFQAISLAEGERFPDARAEMLRRMEKGNLIVNYTGHGSVSGLSNARIFELNDISSLNSNNRFALWVTATCDFGKYDDPAERSGAEYLIDNADGGAIAMITAVREVFSNGNLAFNQNLYNYLFKYDTARAIFSTFGDAMKGGKNSTWNYNLNTRAFSLLGDPGLVLAMPRQKVEITKINNEVPGTGTPDTLKALTKVKIEGRVMTPSGLPLSSFEGTANVVVYDKSTKLNTFKCNPTNYYEQSSIVFSGQAVVKNGTFTQEFFMPLDISYTVGRGNIAVYVKAKAGSAFADWDGSGCDKSFIICCSDTLPLDTDVPPRVRLYLNDSLWLGGSITGNSPVLVAKAADDMGINTTGLGIGRELVAILDGDTRNPIVLNEYFSGTLGDYRSGTIRYPLNELSEGEHTLEVKVWDVTNNSATDKTTFKIINGPNTVLTNVSVYPNPFREYVRFRFNQNLLDRDTRITIRLRDGVGRTVYEYGTTWLATGSIFEGLDWHGTDTNGRPLVNGIYYYEIELQPVGGKAARHNGKVVLLREN
jgi:hypothetical protein